MSAGTVCIRRSILALLLVAVAASPLAATEPYLRRWPREVPSPSLRLTDPDGQAWDLGNLRGKVVVVNFWAGWCAPCVDEIPFLNELASNPAMAGKVVVLGVNYKESAAAVRRFSSEHAFRYPILLDKSGEYFKQWTTGVLPTTVLLDRNGRARWRIVGELDRGDRTLRQALEKMLDEPGPGSAAH